LAKASVNEEKERQMWEGRQGCGTTGGKGSIGLGKRKTDEDEKKK